MHVFSVVQGHIAYSVCFFNQAFTSRKRDFIFHTLLIYTITACLWMLCLKQETYSFILCTHMYITDKAYLYKKMIKHYFSLFLTVVITKQSSKAFSESVVMSCSNEQLVSWAGCFELDEHSMARHRENLFRKTLVSVIWKWLVQLAICFHKELKPWC